MESRENQSKNVLSKS